MNRENKKRQYDKRYFKTHPNPDPFTCKECGMLIVPEGAGSGHRNHCPYCLTSLHVDNVPGDRESECRGRMEAIAVWVRKGGEWAIIHRCKRCGKIGSNRIAADDDPEKLLALALRPFAHPEIPAEDLAAMAKRLEN